MEQSKGAKGISGQVYVDSHAERRLFRCASVESLMADPDSFESMLRYARGVKASRSEQERRAQLGRLGKDSRFSED